MSITPLLGSLGTILSLCLQLSPSPAIYKGLKEGIIKTLEITKEHFKMLYPSIKYQYREYDGQHCV